MSKIGQSSTNSSHHTRQKSGGGGQGSNSSTKHREHAPTDFASPTLFSQETFSLDEYVRDALAGSTEEQVRTLHKMLASTKESAASDMQRSVHRNYTEFVDISKAISELEGDLSAIRGLLHETRQECEGFLTAGSRQSANKNAVFDNDDGYYGDELVDFNMLQSPAVPGSSDPSSTVVELVERIEGLSKYVDEARGCFVKDGSGMAEMHPENPRLGRPVYFVLFQDILVVAHNKKKDSKKKFYVDCSWNLQSVTVMDLQDQPGENKNAIRIVGSKTCTYMFDSADSKQTWFDLINQSAAQRPGTSIDQSVGGLSLPSKAVLASMNDLSAHGRMSTLKHVSSRKAETTNPELAWLQDMPDELEIFIAHREFDQAVQCVCRAQGIFETYGLDAASLPSLKRQLDEKRAQLCRLVAKDLGNQFLPQHQIRQNIDRLMKLGMGEHARDLFLATRSDVTRLRIKQLSFEGDTVQYIHELAYVVFTLIKHTCEWYRSSFKDPRMASGFVKWVKNELENYATIFRCQVFHDSQAFRVIADCLYATTEESKIIADVGLDLGFIFEQMFCKDISSAIEVHRAHLMANIVRATADDDFTSLVETPFLKLDSGDENVDMGLQKYAASKSTLSFTQLILRFLLADLTPLLTESTSMAYYSETVDSVSRFFETYFRHLVDLSHDPQFSDRQHMIMQVNMYYLSHQLFPFLRKCLEGRPLSPAKDQGLTTTSHYPQFLRDAQHPGSVAGRIGFSRPIPEWEKIERRLQAMYTIMHTAYVQRSARITAQSTYAFGPACVLNTGSGTNKLRFIEFESDTYPIDDATLPSEAMCRAVKELADVYAVISQIAEELKTVTGVTAETDSLVLNKADLISGILNEFFTDIMSPKNWITEHGYDRVFGYTGFHQFLLDIHFILKVVDAYLTPAITKLANDASTKGMKIYHSRVQDTSRLLKPGDWYNKRVAEAIKKGGPEMRILSKRGARIKDKTEVGK